jgi:hypothetical protein
VFNALTGECDFTFDTVSLPPAKYKGIKLDIANNDSTLMEGYSILLEGTFEYADTVRNFSIKLSNEKDIRPYLMDGPAQHIGENDSTEFRLALNANRWLDYIDLKTDYIDEGTLSFKPGTKALIVDRSVDANVYRDFNKTVRLNIINSGTLAVIFN